MTNVSVAYYLSQTDAENQQNALSGTYTYNSTSDTIFYQGRRHHYRMFQNTII